MNDNNMKTLSIDVNFNQDYFCRKRRPGCKYILEWNLDRKWQCGDGLAAI